VQLRPFRAASPYLPPFRCHIENNAGEHAIVVPPRSYDRQCCTTVLHSGHEIPRTENRTEFNENRTKFTETEKFGSMFGTRFSRTEFTEVLSVLYLGKPKEPICTELEQ
jgi:hypothetical protein